MSATKKVETAVNKDIMERILSEYAAMELSPPTMLKKCKALHAAAIAALPILTKVMDGIKSHSDSLCDPSLEYLFILAPVILGKTLGIFSVPRVFYHTIPRKHSKRSQ